MKNSKLHFPGPLQCLGPGAVAQAIPPLGGPDGKYKIVRKKLYARGE